MTPQSGYQRVVRRRALLCCEERLVMCFIKLVDVSFFVFVCVIYSYAFPACEIKSVYIIMCKFMGHAVNLLIYVSLMRFVCSMCGSFKCARSTHLCAFVSFLVSVFVSSLFLCDERGSRGKFKENKWGPVL